MTLLDVATALGVFVLAALFDAIVTAWTRAVTIGEGFRACVCAFCLCWVGAGMSWAFLKISWWYLWPESLGYAFGTYAMVTWWPRLVKWWLRRC